MIVLMKWIGLLLVGAVVIDIAAHVLVAAIPYLAVLLFFVVIAAVLMGRHRRSL